MLISLMGENGNRVSDAKDESEMWRIQTSIRRLLHFDVHVSKSRFGRLLLIQLWFLFTASSGCLLEYELDDVTLFDADVDSNNESYTGTQTDDDDFDTENTDSSFTDDDTGTSFQVDSECDSDNDGDPPCHSLPGGAIIFEESFETPDINDLTVADPAGWSQTDHPSYVGLNDEDSGLFTTPYGEQALKVYGATTIASTTEAILDAVLEDNTTYTLTFNVAKRSDQAATGYLVELVAVAADGTVTVLDSVRGAGVDTVDMSHTDAIQFTTKHSQGHLGKKIAIHLGKPAEVDWRTNPQYDNIKLQATSRVYEGK